VDDERFVSPTERAEDVLARIQTVLNRGMSPEDAVRVDLCQRRAVGERVATQVNAYVST